MFPLIAILFLVVPIFEIYLLIQVGGIIGAGWTIFLVVLTAVIGVALLKHQGLSTLNRAQARLEHNELPAREILEGMGLVVAGALLLTPGFFTDAVGFLLLFPPTRIWLVSAVAARLVSSASVTMHTHQQHGHQPHGHQQHGHQQRDGNVIDGVKYHRDE